MSLKVETNDSKVVFLWDQKPPQQDGKNSSEEKVGFIEKKPESQRLVKKMTLNLLATYRVCNGHYYKKSVEKSLGKLERAFNLILERSCALRQSLHDGSAEERDIVRQKTLESMQLACNSCTRHYTILKNRMGEEALYVGNMSSDVVKPVWIRLRDLYGKEKRSWSLMNGAAPLPANIDNIVRPLMKKMDALVGIQKIPPQPSQASMQSIQTKAPLQDIQIN